MRLFSYLPALVNFVFTKETENSNFTVGKYPTLVEKTLYKSALKIKQNRDGYLLLYFHLFYQNNVGVMFSKIYKVFCKTTFRKQNIILFWVIKQYTLFY